MRTTRHAAALALTLLLIVACSRNGLLVDGYAPRGGTAGTQAPRDPTPGSTDGPRSLLPDLAGRDAPETVEPARPCGRFEHIEVHDLDLLFVVDDSGSMKEEQAALRREMPRMIERLASGDTDGDGVADLPPVAELHLGVVSTDMGLVGVRGIDKCNGLGDDGILQHAPSPELSGCASQFPSFLSYRAGQDLAANVASDFECIATLGTDGCGFEQQLEAGLKALWPASDDRITFLPDPQGFGALGHGDRENAGFLRPAGGRDASLLAVVLVTDEDDCSAKNTSLFRPPAYLDPNVPADFELLMQGLNVRCNFNQDSLYDVSRYVDGFKALRAGSDGLVVFGAIVGVPPDLTTPEALETVDFADPFARNAFYDGLLNDSRMQPTIDGLGTDSPDDDRLFPSCDTANGKAYPPLRIVQTARAFGRDAVVQSICQDDFGPAIDAILAAITRASSLACVTE